MGLTTAREPCKWLSFESPGQDSSAGWRYPGPLPGVLAGGIPCSSAAARERERVRQTFGLAKLWNEAWSGHRCLSCLPSKMLQDVSQIRVFDECQWVDKDAPTHHDRLSSAGHCKRMANPPQFLDQVAKIGFSTQCSGPQLTGHFTPKT